MKVSLVDIELLISSYFRIWKFFLCCKTYGEKISLKEQIVCGLSSKFSKNCKNCAELCSFGNFKMIGPSKKIVEVNHR